jgi:hypothetical protein
MSRSPAAVVKQKKLRALELRSAGCTYEEIASDLGYSSRGNAWRLTQSALMEAINACAERYLVQELDRYDAVLSAFWEPMRAGDHRAGEIVLGVLGEQNKLLGLTGEIKGRTAAFDTKPYGVVLSPEELVEYHREALRQAELRLSDCEQGFRDEPRKATRASVRLAA